MTPGSSSWTLLQLLLSLLLISADLTNGRRSEGHQRQNHHPTIGAKKPNNCPNPHPTKSPTTKSIYLWKIKRDPPVYLFGTIHVPYTRVWQQVSDQVKRAFERSENIVFELDLSHPNTLKSLYRCKLLPGKTTLRKIMPPLLYKKLRGHMETLKKMLPSWLYHSTVARGKSNSLPGNWERLRPIWLLLMLNSLNDQRKSGGGETRQAPSLDEYLAQKAHYLDKKVGAIEEVKEQCTPLNSLNQTQVFFALEQTLLKAKEETVKNKEQSKKPNKDKKEQEEEEINQDESSSESDLVQNYNCGSLDGSVFNKDSMQLPELSDSATRARAESMDAYLRTELIDKRNVKMAARFHSTLIKYPRESFFFALGAGHFFGSQSIVNLIAEYGYDIQPVHPSPLTILSSKSKTADKYEQRMMDNDHNHWMQQDDPLHLSPTFLSSSSSRRQSEMDPLHYGSRRSGERGGYGNANNYGAYDKTARLFHQDDDDDEPSFREYSGRKNNFLNHQGNPGRRRAGGGKTKSTKQFNDLWVRLPDFTTPSSPAGSGSGSSLYDYYNRNSNKNNNIHSNSNINRQSAFYASTSSTKKPFYYSTFLLSVCVIWILKSISM